MQSVSSRIWTRVAVTLLSLSTCFSISGSPPLISFVFFSFHLCSNSLLTSFSCPVCVSSQTGVSLLTDRLLRRTPSLPCSFSLSHWSLVDLCVSLLPLLATNWPCSSDSPLVDFLSIWRVKHSYFRTLYGHTYTRTHTHTHSQPTTIHSHTPVRLHRHTPT